ncbi:hypothetical protein JZX86_17150 [Agrobacterium rosae]|uniref:hypothetical protein n=1 Tax=Agrobacterium rosae TaxID=1972867 RepID=UPI0019D337AC|nr:hypothetical protein [Agrobacterium rosae]MBN7807082.1 hypothetical protein [Agrobacterium rosae]
MLHNEINPPKPCKSDDLYAVFFAAVSMFPWVGPILAEALKRRWPSKFEKILAQWHEDSTAQINYAAKAISTLEAVEEGANANGSYRIIGNTILEVEANVEAAHDYGDTLSVTFPAAFARPPIIQIFDESHSLKVATVTRYGVSLKLLDRVYQETVTFRYQANGRWH